MQVIMDFRLRFHPL